MAAKKGSATVVLTQVKETKGTFKFDAAEDDLGPAMRAAYVQKHVFAETGAPQKIKVTIEWTA